MIKNIAFIGAGNMAGAIIKGLLEQNYPAASIQATTRTTASAERAAAELGIHTSTDNRAAAEWADVIVLAVKPQMLQATCEGLADSINTQLIVSVAAGIDTASIARWLGNEVAVVRSMPNTPSQVGVGASGLYANTRASAADKAFAEQIATATGLCVWVQDEAQMHAITAVSGSGPAYYFLFMEAMIRAGVKLGLTPDTARQLTLQTALGAATLAGQVDVPVDELKRRVMSPGGTTERAISAFEAGNLPQLVEQAMTDCAARSQTLADELAK
ncbi:pyrroline-5-carboxylate reductase [Gilvimarinus sp. SDUM040013]|uniref:Pyrroline-5-carboxylate reductase n=1 Tax=Gilvimarinus gilvus TaxID=3058038 RepID=A0ABU4RZ30_9GAMM|nr:pyrroline-5-carboxylate reductase [Gilvimarinus sp. SDUM040013]MDO3387597.1 pyrroline-5-carboxylate reductase [Gilvimarinus sp. SDUM040013]MDX6850138.1 pyrroline-5-carboxylate reductase [Gilvimarinus sp. SDUM040013]